MTAPSTRDDARAGGRWRPRCRQKWLPPRSTLSVRLGGSEHVPKLRALKPGLLLLPLLPGPLAAALHVCHSSLCRQSSAPSRARPCRALRKCGERHDQSTGAAIPLKPHGNARCQARGCTRGHKRGPRRLQQPAAPSRQTPPNSRRARAPARRVLAGQALAGGRPAWSRGRHALPRDSNSGAPYLLAGTSHARPEAVPPKTT